MKVTILSGASPHSHDGVGDYAWRLGEALQAEHDVSLVVARGAVAPAARPTGAVPIHTVSPGWGPRTCREVLDHARSLAPAAVLLQFVPQLFGWHGTKPFLAALLWRLRRAGIRIVTVAHEFDTPFAPSPATFARAWTHRLLLRLIVGASHKVVLTTPYCFELFARRYPARRSDFHQIPVGCNLPVVPVTEAERAALRRRLGIAPGDLVLSTFASPVEPAVSLLGALCRWSTGEGLGIRILAVGRAGSALRERLSRHPEVLERLVVTGPVSDDQGSRFLSLGDLHAAFYPDGASTRRSSLMAAFAHGLPVIANAGLLTDPELRATGALHLLNGTGAQEDVAGFRRLCRDPGLRRTLGDRGRALFAAQFSWERIGKQHAQVLSEALAP